MSTAFYVFVNVMVPLSAAFLFLLLLPFPQGVRRMINRVLTKIFLLPGPLGLSTIASVLVVLSLFFAHVAYDLYDFTSKFSMEVSKHEPPKVSLSEHRLVRAQRNFWVGLLLVVFWAVLSMLLRLSKKIVEQDAELATYRAKAGTALKQAAATAAANAIGGSTPTANTTTTTTTNTNRGTSADESTSGGRSDKARKGDSASETMSSSAAAKRTQQQGQKQKAGDDSTTANDNNDDDEKANTSSSSARDRKDHGKDRGQSSSERTDRDRDGDAQQGSSKREALTQRKNPSDRDRSDRSEEKRAGAERHGGERKGVEGTVSGH